MKQLNSVKQYESASAGLRSELMSALPQLLPRLKVIRAKRQRGRSPQADLIVDVATPLGDRHRLHVAVHSVAAPGRVREPLRRLAAALSKQERQHPILASSFVSPRVREICREEKVGYFDLAGNCRLEFNDLYVEKIVDRNPFPVRGRPASLFSPVSSRIIRALLEEPVRAWQVQELARAAGVSLGQTSNVCRRLNAEGYLRKDGRRLTLAQPGELLDAWSAQYTAHVHRQEAYYSFERDPEALIARVAGAARAKGWRYAVTSFAAASLVAPFVRGIGTVQCYIDPDVPLKSWVEALDLRPVESGPNIVLMVPDDAGVFYRTQNVGGAALVGTVQLYLDLHQDPARGREQAEFLRKEKLPY